MSTLDLNSSCPSILVLFVLLLRCIKWLYSKPTFDTRTRNIAAIAVALSGRNSLITQLHFCIFCTLQDCNIFSGCKEWLSLISCWVPWHTSPTWLVEFLLAVLVRKSPHYFVMTDLWILWLNLWQLGEYHK